MNGGHFMSVFRVHKTKNYTVMSNHHLRDKNLSLKAKGLLSVMFSLPDSWNYSIPGLCSILKENETAVRSTIKELKETGYLIVDKKNPCKEEGRSKFEYVYNIYETPQEIEENKDKQDATKQGVESLALEAPDVEHHPHNKRSDISNTDESITDIFNTDFVNPNKEKKNAYHSNEWFNSQHIKNMLTEESIQYNPIDRKSFNWSAFKNQVKIRLEELGYTTSPYTTNRFLVVSKYFFKRYEERTRKPHIKINQDALDNILDKFGFGPNPDYFQNVDIETYMKVIDEYFGTSFSEYTDHHYSHFMSGYIRKNLLMKIEDREDTL